MALILGEGEKELTSGSLLIKLGSSQNYLSATITDNNAHTS
jgi:hypothetical protein